MMEYLHMLYILVISSTIEISCMSKYFTDSCIVYCMCDRFVKRGFRFVT